MKTKSAWVALLALALAVPAALAQAQDTKPAGDEQPGQEVLEIKMFAENWKWTPNLIRVPVGTRLKIEVQNVDAPHRFEIKKLDVKVPLPEDETTLVEFVVTEPGTYRWRCSRPCGNGCAKMTGKLVVE